jgi:hypothetical protein
MTLGECSQAEEPPTDVRTGKRADMELAVIRIQRFGDSSGA